MRTQSTDFHDVFAYVRDHARPVTEDDVDLIAATRDFDTPSLTAFDARKPFKERPRVGAPKPVSPERIRAERSVSQWQRYVAARGGSRTVRPVVGFGTGPNRPHAPLGAVQRHGSDSELIYDRHMDSRDRRAADELRRIWSRVYGPLTRFQQAEFAFITGDRDDVIFL